MAYLPSEAVIAQEIKELLSTLGADTSRLEKLLQLTVSEDKLSPAELASVEAKIK